MTGAIALDGVANTRDLGGIVCADGRPIRSGALIRSGTLARATASDVRALANRNVRLVIDLRCDIESNKAPNRRVPGARMERLPVLEGIMPGVSRDEESDRRVIEKLARSAAVNPQIAEEYLSGLYRTMMTDPFTQSRYARFLQVIANHDPNNGAILWNCTAGKDRVGLATVFVLECLGADRTAIARDYLETNRFSDKTIEAVTRRVPRLLRHRLAPAIRILFSAQRSYLEATYESAEEQCGSMDAFLTEKLGATPDVRALMRAHYLV